MINILVVEDSPVIRDQLVSMIEHDLTLHVSATAESGEAALAVLLKHRPDVILMDVHLPGIDGIETTRRIMATIPTPIVVCTASGDADEKSTLMRALDAGAVDARKKPGGSGGPNAEAEAAALRTALKLMAEVKVVRRWPRLETRASRRPKSAVPPRDNEIPSFDPRIAAIGASTGGPAAICELLGALPRPFPAPILVVQHIASGFMGSFADWLESTANVPVVVARSGTTPRPGYVYVPPDDRHLRVDGRGQLEVSAAAPVNSVRPSVSVLFKSVAERFGRQAAAVLLTGMGRDGAEELRLLADLGALTIAQDEASSVVFGMPAEAIALGAARYVLPPNEIAALLTRCTRQHGAEHP